MFLDPKGLSSQIYKQGKTTGAFVIIKYKGKFFPRMKHYKCIGKLHNSLSKEDIEYIRICSHGSNQDVDLLYEILENKMASGGEIYLDGCQTAGGALRPSSSSQAASLSCKFDDCDVTVTGNFGDVTGIPGVTPSFGRTGGRPHNKKSFNGGKQNE
jgi:hypothetical protein